MKRICIQGFTLAELLAVIIIISMLSALGLGAYKKSVEQSRFAEGLAAASAVVEAINRARFDEKIEGRSSPSVHKYATLDVNLPEACTSGNCRATKYFEVYIEKDAGANYEVVRAKRKKGNYYVEISSNFGSNKDELACVGNNTDGVTFCESMGYVNCTEMRCTK